MNRSPSVAIFKTKISFIFRFSVFLLLFLTCKLPTDPDNPSNADTNLLLKSSNGIVSDQQIYDSVGNDVTILVSFNYPAYVKTTVLKILSQDNETLFDTILISLSKENKDTISVSKKLLRPGKNMVTIRSLIENGSIKNDTAFFNGLTSNQKPLPPKSFRISSYTPVSLKFTWQRAERALDYAIYKSPTSDSEFKMYRDSLKNNEFIDQISPTPFYYYVVARNLNGESERSNIVFSKDTGNIAPQWKNQDTLSVKLIAGNYFTLNLPESSYDVNNDQLSYSLISKTPGHDTIIGSVYKFTSSLTDTGKYNTSIECKDPQNCSDTLYLFIVITSIDTLKPKITIPGMASDSLNLTDTISEIVVICTDASSIKRVEAVIGSATIPVSKRNDTTFSIIPKPLTAGQINRLTITVQDNASPPNSAVKILYITYKPLLEDTIKPAIRRVYPLNDSTSVSSSTISLQVVCKDSGGIDMVRCILNDKACTVTRASDSLFSIVLSGLEANKISTANITAIDKNGNISTMDIHIKYDPLMADNTPPILLPVNPVTTTVKTANSTATIQVSCNDESGIFSLVCKRNGVVVTTSKEDTVYTVSLMNLSSGKTDTIVFTATDSSSARNTSVLTFLVVYDQSLNDRTGPLLVLVSPSKDSAKVSTASVNISLQCTDPNGITELTGSIGTTALTITKGSGDVYTTTVSGLVSGLNTLTFTATDGSANANKTTRAFTIIYDPTLSDVSGPVFTFIEPAADSSKVALRSTMVRFTCADSSGITSVTCFLDAVAVSVVKETGNTYTTDGIALTPGHNTLMFSATDASTNANKTVRRFTIVCDPTMIDNQGPSITLQSPAADSSKVSSSSIGLEILCTDVSGVASVNCTRGTSVVNFVKGTGNVFTASIIGLSAGVNTMTISAVDASSNANKSSRHLTIIYDPSMTDNVKPVMTLKNPAANGQRLLQDSVTVIISCKDDNGIASVSCARGRSAVAVTHIADSLYSAFISGLTPAKFDTITFTATDKSTNANVQTMKVILNYNTRIGDISAQTPSANATAVPLLPSFTWTGGNDPDGEAVYYRVLYGTSSSNLDNRTSEVTASPARITTSNALAPDTVYYWSVIAYSKTNTDTSRSSIRSFTTVDEIPVITTQPANKSVRVGQSVTFSIKATGTNLKFQWQRGTTPIDGATDPSYTIATTTDAYQNATFQCVVSNNADTITSGAATLTILHGITYNINGATSGNVPGDNNSYAPGASVTLAARGTLERTGYTFGGWRAPDGTIYDGGALFTMGTTNITLEAVWNINLYTVTYNANTGSGTVPIDNNRYQNGQPVSVLGNASTLSKAGFTFVNWNTKADGSGVTRTFGSSFTMELNNVELFANFVEVVPQGMKPIPAGRFYMGQEGIADTVHEVILSPFWMDSTEVTQKDYESLMHVNKSSTKGAEYPIDLITWDDAILYCNQRSKRDGLDTVYNYLSVTNIYGDVIGAGGDVEGLVIDYSKRGYRLPTEAEWEYACRAGTTTLFYWGYAGSSNENYAWYSENSNSVIHPVAGKTRNLFNLYDMSGNVAEYCNDFILTANYNNEGPLTNPTGPIFDGPRVIRGGNFWNTQDNLRSAHRMGTYFFSRPPFGRAAGFGFRCVLPRSN